jgi:hypothetical protein
MRNDRAPLHARHSTSPVFRRAALVALLALLVLVACGRSGLMGLEDLSVRITAPVSYYAGCGMPVDLQVIGPDGQPRGGVHTIHVTTEIGAVSPGPDAQTDGSGLLSVVVLFTTGATPASGSITAAADGNAPASKLLVFNSNAAPAITLVVTTAGGALPGDPVQLSVNVPTTVQATLTDDDGKGVLRWGSDGVPLTLSGNDALLTAARGEHLVYAQYVDCAGQLAEATVRVAGGTKTATHITTGLVSQNVSTIDVDRGDGDAVWLGFSADHPPQHVVDGGAMVTLGNPPGGQKTIDRVRWAGGTKWVTSYTNQDGFAVYNDPPVTGATPSPYDAVPGQPLHSLTVCTDGQAYAAEAQNLWSWPANTQMDLGTNLDVVEATPRGDAQPCGFALGFNGHLVWETGGELGIGGPLHDWFPLGAQIRNLAFGAGDLWAVADNGLYRVADPESGSALEKLFDVDVQGGGYLPAQGFSFNAPGRLVAGTLGGVTNVWISERSPGPGQDALLRIVEITPVDGTGAPGVRRRIPIAYPDTVGLHGQSLAIPRQADGTIVDLSDLWLATDAGIWHLSWR